MKKPNFFIIGAPKCGTTSLAAWLAEHPQVYMPATKEPMFFNVDWGGRYIFNYKDYEALFDDANEQHVAVGEASTSYLISQVAVPMILEYSPSARFIVLLRKPQEMAISLHAQVCKGLENQHDFTQAWKLQADRALGNNMPPFAKYPELYQYGERCRIGTQLVRLFGSVSYERILVVFLEDIRHFPDVEFGRVLDFLGLVQYRPKEFAVLNTRIQVKYPLLKLAMNFLGYVKNLAGIRLSTGIFRQLHRFNHSRSGNPAISKDVLDEMDSYFAEEISIVEKLVGRIPMEWKQ